MSWERREANRQARMARRGQRCCRPNMSWLGGAVLITIGSVLFLDNLGWISADQVWRMLWPAAAITFGVWKLVTAWRNSDRLLGGLAVAFGTFFLLGALGVFQFRTHNNNWWIAVLLIAAGFMALQKSFERQAEAVERARRLPPSEENGLRSESPVAAVNEPLYIDDWVFAGSKKRRVEASDFRGGEVHCVMGEIYLDLRGAYQPRPDRPMVLEAHTVMGAVRLRVPQDWVVQLEGSSMFGNFQDKTLPVQGMNGRAPTLVVTGGAFFGEVVVDS